MKIKSIATVVLLVSVFSVFAQKIKYKDLFPILNAKNWTEGAPQLKAFLSDPKNAEEANAHLQMGLMLEDQFYKKDVAKDTSAVYNSGDSAIFYLNTAKELITAKELKKHDQYYQSFFRRDLRTGDFGIKESDVHLDIEKKVENIETRMSNSRGLSKKVKNVEERNQGTLDKYKQLSSKYDNYRTLLLGADDEANTLLQEIKSGASQTKELADEVKRIATSLGTEKFRGEIRIKEIKEFGSDGMISSDFSRGIIELWDYESWAIDVTSEINGSIGLLKSMILNYSKTIREKKGLIKKSRDTEIDTLSLELITLFEKYDPESVALKLLQTEASEVRIMKQVDFSINKALQDSSLVGAQLKIFKAALEEANKMSLVLESINTDDLNVAKNTYSEYVDSFFQTYTTAGNYVSEMKTWSRRQKKWAGDAVEYWKERNRWGIVTVEGEPEKKIPLFLQDAPLTEFYTIGIPVSSDEEVMVYGANLLSRKGFVYSFDEGRYAKWGLEYELPGEGNFQLRADTIAATRGSTGFFLLNAAVQENNLCLVSFTNEGALNWSTVVTVPKPPVGFNFDDITQELTVLLYPEEDLPLDNGELGYIVIDRTGNAR